ncbi:type II toxin-antitoxin system PemK/MazF family toxin [Roseomonas stagni]|uniref:Type II toxin-antitoxin system PemK/MazF family toxin n=1 Tax=Falsiroseomonas algicola TaxID=2716930 RepID=A0A6M1LW05_9PROT|nr:type II toxin-antitoxin system PemK/MazF family toxin [Falsiroseomonas algicola]NGM24337.1 type II toxin-antitoxin system PemK/MazF family toxin [Falsiroseomonas algicola]
MRRGDVVRIGGASESYAPPLHAVIVQADLYPSTASVTVCPITENSATAPLLRMPISDGEQVPLPRPAWVMVDKITMIPRQSVGQVIGHLGREDQMALDGLLMVFLGLG